MSASNSILNNMLNESETYDHSINPNQSYAPAQELSQVWLDQPSATALQPSPGTGDGSEYDIWNVPYDPAWASWSVGSDFDLDAMNASIADTINKQHGHMYAVDSMQNFGTATAAPSLSKPSVPRSMIESIEQCWCSYSGPKSDSTPGTVTPVMAIENNETQDVDETYRYNLASRLQHRPCKSTFSFPTREICCCNMSTSISFQELPRMRLRLNPESWWWEHPLWIVQLTCRNCQMTIHCHLQDFST